ncbi:mas-related G-protein coupled receptor member B4-like [Nannospalax galili]|uniref:mas-related G-protein coupled receptor member B4-like n=1 Tax=Nannospalax galili TaxID=1026970 RepID=UPI0004ED6203|nr:mas-related G-protein coupled receptor member B4-like [Nannospalax galili]
MDTTISALGTEITTVNGSDHTPTSSCDIVFITLIFLINIIAMVGLAGNAVVLWLLSFHMHRNAFSVYVLNLAGADFLFLCFQMVCSLWALIHLFHSIYIPIPKFFNIVFTFTYLAGLSMLSAISAERCLSVMWPIWYHCQRPRHMSAVTCALLWALSLLLSLLEGKGCGDLFNDFDHDMCSTLDFIAFAWLIFLFVVLSGSSLTLLVRIFCGTQRIPVTRLYVTIAFTVMAYLLFGLPFGICSFILTWIENFNDAFICHFFLIVTFLSSMNSCANPIIYFFLGSIRHRRVQHRTLKLLLQRALQDTPEEEECEDRGSPGKPEEPESVPCSS